VEYGVDITATVAKRQEWRLIPHSIVEHVTNERTRQRLNEITDQLIMRSAKEPSLADNTFLTNDSKGPF
jgi:hypothetical protein